jgi:hypothetical protein
MQPVFSAHQHQNFAIKGLDPSKEGAVAAVVCDDSSAVR